MAATEAAIFTLNNNIPVSSNFLYEVSCWIYTTTATTGKIVEIYIKPVGYTISALTYTPVSGTTIGSWNKATTFFNSGANTNIKLGVYYTYTTTAGQFYGNVDSIQLNGPIRLFSELKRVNVNTDCSTYNLYLTWLNNLGGWEFWNFTARKDYGVEFGEVKQVRRDVMSTWDTDFISGQTIDDFTSIEAYDTLIVRSKPLTSVQMTQVAKIKTAIKVQQIVTTGDNRTVLIDKDSFTIRQDRQKNHILEFSLRYTDPLPIQSQ